MWESAGSIVLRVLGRNANCRTGSEHDKIATGPQQGTAARVKNTSAEEFLPDRCMCFNVICPHSKQQQQGNTKPTHACSRVVASLVDVLTAAVCAHKLPPAACVGGCPCLLFTRQRCCCSGLHERRADAPAHRREGGGACTRMDCFLWGTIQHCLAGSNRHVHRRNGLETPQFLHPQAFHPPITPNPNCPAQLPTA